MDRDWAKLGKAVTRRRVELGIDTIAAFARRVGLSTRILGDLESGKRSSYDPATLAKVEQALGWPEGRVDELLNGPAAESASWLSTPEGIARHIHRDDLPLVALLHRAGLTETDLFRLILKVRARREKQNAELLEEVAAAIRELGGWAPERAYPPMWLVEDDAT